MPQVPAMLEVPGCMADGDPLPDEGIRLIQAGLAAMKTDPTPRVINALWSMLGISSPRRRS